MQFSLNYKFFRINICKGLYSAIKKMYRTQENEAQGARGLSNDVK